MALHPGFVTAALTTALDTRLAEMGMVVRNGDRSPRQGVLYDPLMDAALIFSTTNTNPITVGIPVSSFLVARNGQTDGITKFTNDGTIGLNVATAPTTGQSRIDIVYVKHNDSSQGDPNDLPIFGILSGTAATTGSQVPPSLATIPGAMELARLLVPGGATSSQSSGFTITQTYPYTVFVGGIVPFRSLAELKAWSPENGAFARVLGGTNILYVYDLPNTVWRPAVTPAFAYAGGSGSIASGTTDTTLAAGSSGQGTNDANIIDASNTNVFLCQYAGYYRLLGSAVWASNATGVRSLRLTRGDVNFSPDVADVRAAVSGFVTGQSVSFVVYMNVGEFIKLKGFQNSGGALNYAASLSAELLQ